jgi:hypothetical protein
MHAVKALIAILLLAAATNAYSQSYGWQKVDTVTSGGFDDYNPQIDHGGRVPSAFPVKDNWMVFERWNSGTPSIASMKYLGQELSWDPTVYTISPASPGVIQKLPDVCSTAGGFLIDSIYVSKSLTLASWEEKSDSNWDIYYSTCDPDSSNWSLPISLTNDIGNNEQPKVRVFSDSSFIVLWKRDSTILYSLVGPKSVSNPKQLANSNSDRADFDFYYRLAFSTNGMLVWTNEGMNGNRYCLAAQIYTLDFTTVSSPDTIKCDGDIQNPCIMALLSYPTGFTFDLKINGRYEAWMAYYDSWPPTWHTEMIDGDTSSDNLHAAFFSPPQLTATVSKAIDRTSQFVPWGFSVWERRTSGDTSLVFSDADTVINSGYNRNPVISSSVFYYGVNLYMGYAVFESNRTGSSHIYARYFFYNLGKVNDKNPTPLTFYLRQNYPNPFNPTTMITYRLPAASHATLKVYDVLGRLVETLVDGRQTPGEHSVAFDAKRLASGVYFYQLRTGGLTETKKMLVEK